MPLFHYEAVDGKGRRVKGVMPASDETNLELRLKMLDVWLLDATQEVRASAGAKAAAARSGWRTGWYKVKRRELIEFCSLMSFETRVGIPVVQALELASQDCQDPRFRATLDGLKLHLEGGLLLCEALEKYPQTFSLHFTSVIRAGESSGKLTEAFTDLKGYLEWVEQVVADVRQASLYPLITLIVVSGFSLFLFTFIIPQFVSLMKLVKVPVPLLTQVVFAVSDFAKATWWLWVLLMLFLVVGIPLGRRMSKRFAYWVDYVKINLPLFGELNLMLALSRFAHNLSILYSSGIPIIQAFHLCQGLVENLIVEEAVAQMETDLKSGNTISEAMRKRPIFPAILLRMVTMGETTGKLDEALHGVAEYYNEIIPRRIKKLFTVLEPAMTLGLIFMVGVVALSIYLPMLSLMTAVGQTNNR